MFFHDGTLCVDIKFLMQMFEQFFPNFLPALEYLMGSGSSRRNGLNVCFDSGLYSDPEDKNTLVMHFH